MKFLFVICLAFMLAACGKGDIKLIRKASDKGYKKYITACTIDINDQKTCTCQADLLKRFLPDNDILIVANAGIAAANNNPEEAKRLMGERPDLAAAVKKLAVSAKQCGELD